MKDIIRMIVPDVTHELDKYLSNQISSMLILGKVEEFNVT